MPVLSARRRWADLIAVPAVIILVLSAAVISVWPEESEIDSYSGVSAPLYGVGLAPARRWTPEPLYTEPWNAQEEARCVTPAGPAPDYRVPPPSQASDIAREAMRAPPCQTLALGTTAVLAGADDDEVTQVTASPAEPPAQPPPDGRQRVTYRLHFRYLGINSVQVPQIWVFGATTGTGWMFPVDSGEPTVWLRPGQEADQFVTFDIGANEQLVRLRLGQNPSAVDWVIG